MSASAASVNPFGLLNDDGDDDEFQPVKKDVKEVKKSDAKAPAKAAPAAAAAGPSSSGPKDAGKSQGRPPKREYERHSGTGRGRRSDGAEDKRGGSGKYNWGSKDAGTNPGDDAGERVDREQTEEEKAAAEAAAEARRKEEQQMTLDEYLKKKGEKTEEEKTEIRKAESIDMKGLKVKDVTKEVEVWTIGDDKGGKEAKGKKSGRKATAFTDVNFTTAPIETSSPAGGRGRGRGRPGEFRERRPGGGGRGGGGGGGGSSEAAAVALADDSAFPSLGGSK